MFKKIFAITGRDLKSGMRDSMVLYALLFPVILAVILRFFIPAASSVSINFAVVEGTKSELTEFLKDYGNVEILKDEKALEERILQNDDIIGISDKDGYSIIAQGNEAEGIVEMGEGLLLIYENPEMDLPVEVSFDDIGWNISPLSLYGATLLIVMFSFIAGIVIAFNVVEDKQYSTLNAINVSPITKFQYVTGKSILGFIIPLIQMYVVLLILDVFYVNKLMMTVIVLVSSLIGVILGFLNGVINKDTLSAVSSMKASAFPMLLGLLGGMLLNEKWHPLLYWNPYYWSYISIDKIIRTEATWTDVLISSFAIILITAIVFVFIRKRIMKGLN